MLLSILKKFLTWFCLGLKDSSWLLKENHKVVLEEPLPWNSFSTLHITTSVGLSWTFVFWAKSKVTLATRPMLTYEKIKLTINILAVDVIWLIYIFI